MPVKSEGRSKRAAAKQRAAVTFDDGATTGGENGDGDNSDAEDIGEFDLGKALREYQRKKDAKASSRAAASARQRAQLVDKARDDANAMARDGCELLEGILDQAKAFRTQVADYTDSLKRLEESFEASDDAVEALLVHYRRDLPELSHRRAKVIDDASRTAQDHSARRAVALREITNNAKAYVWEGEELKNLAVDASAYIKHFKAMLLS